MFDNLKEKTYKSVDKSIDNTREAARIMYNDAKLTTSLHQRECTGITTENGTDVVKTGFPTSVPTLKSRHYGGWTSID